MQRIVIWAGLIAFAAALPAMPAVAGSISITTTQQPRYENETLTVAVTISNKGDEAAHALAAVLRFGDRSVRGTRHEELAPGATVQDELALPVGPLGPGRWVYSLAVDYADANLYPFQALQMGAITVGDIGPAKVTATKITAEPIAQDGILSIELKNLSGDPRPLRVTTHVPEGLEVTADVGELTLEPWAERTVRATVVNRTALAGSRYPVFVVAEYDEPEGHVAMAYSGIVEITSAANPVERHSDVFRWAAIALGILFVLAVLAIRLRSR